MSDMRQWAVRQDGEILFTMLGPEGELLTRSAAAERDGVVIYRDYEPPNDDRPASDWGPWRDA